jgi:Raf kinase inhibitor-like YbhB/YbcL family protein
MISRRAVLLGALAALAAVQCAGGESKEGKVSMTLVLTSAAFKDGGAIPSKYTCEGADVSPALQWTRPPEHTKSLALVCDDPDAPMGTWVHWVLYGIPADSTSLPEGVAKEAVVKGVGTQGRNDFRRTGYGGPCPPPGKPHRYFFKLYALDAVLDLRPGAEKKDLEKAMMGHVLAQGQVVGTYRR